MSEGSDPAAHETPTRFLDLEDLLVTARAALAPQEVLVRDHGLLKSAAERPRQSVFGLDAYPEVLEKAAALVESLCTNHALVDGNKRLAYVALRLFLELNGVRLSAGADERFDFVMAVAGGTLRGVEDIASALAVLTE